MSSRPKSKVVRIKVKLFNLEMDDRYFNFDYKVWLNGKIIKEANYSDSHSWGFPSSEQEKLKDLIMDYYGAQLVLESLRLEPKSIPLINK